MTAYGVPMIPGPANITNICTVYSVKEERTLFYYIFLFCSLLETLISKSYLLLNLALIIWSDAVFT